LRPHHGTIDAHTGLSEGKTGHLKRPLDMLEENVRREVRVPGRIIDYTVAVSATGSLALTKRGWLNGACSLADPDNRVKQ